MNQTIPIQIQLDLYKNDRDNGGCNKSYSVEASKRFMPCHPHMPLS